MDKKQTAIVVIGLVVVFLSIWLCSVRKTGFPVRMEQVVDGNTVIVSGGLVVKLFGVNTVLKGGENDFLAKEFLTILLTNRNIWMEYDHADWVSAWIWVGCERSPKFWTVRKAGENPPGCKKGVLVNEQIIKMGWSEPYFPTGISTLRYESRLKAL